MKRPALFLLTAALLLAATLPLRADDPPALALTRAADGSWETAWQGVEGTTYFMQWSPDLVHWHYLPMVQADVGPHTFGGPANVAPQFFVRLRITNQPTIDPDTDDFDGDGLTNWDEVTATFTDPLNPDTDGDGMPDDFEVAHHLNPNDPADAAQDPDHDGLTNLEEKVPGTDPAKRDTDGDGVSDGEELGANATNPRLAQDLDADGMADDLEKHLAKQFLAVNSAPEFWGTFHAGLLAGDLDPAHDYTGDGQPIGALLPTLIAIAKVGPSESGFLQEVLNRYNSMSALFQIPDPVNNPAGEVYGHYRYSVPQDNDGVTSLEAPSDLDPAYLTTRIESLSYQPSTNPTLMPVYAGGAVAFHDAWSGFETNPEPVNATRYLGQILQNRGRLVATRADHPAYSMGYLKVTSKRHIYDSGFGEAVTAEPLTITLPTGRIASDWVDLQPPMIPGQETVMRLVPVQLLSDLNNDGVIDAADEPLRIAALAAGSDDPTKDKGTEFMFHNDVLSNGLWDKEDADPARPANEKSDDDAEQITIIPGITDGHVWLDHPAIAGLSFYKTRECKPADKVNLSPTSKFSVSASNPFPDKLFMRADGNLVYPTINPQLEGDLILKIQAGSSSQEIDAMMMRLTVVKSFGAKKYFHTARDYILENNTKTFNHEIAYGVSTKYRIVAMREESTVMYGLDTYDHAGDKPRLKGIDEVKANFFSDVIINGNQCFSTNFGGYPFPGGMTNRCDGRLCVARAILRPPSDDTHNPNLGGPTARYIGYTDGEPDIINGQIIIPSEFTFATGQIPEATPATPVQGMGGLAAKYNRPELQQSENQATGRGQVNEAGKGVIFTATTYVGSRGDAINFAEDAHKSGVMPLSGGDGSQWELLFLDGSSSVGLVLANPDGVQETLIKGGKHNGEYTTYYINTYLLFECSKPRKP